MNSAITLLSLFFSLVAFADPQVTSPDTPEITVKIVNIGRSETNGIIGYDKNGLERVYVTSLGKFVYDSPSSNWSFSTIQPGKAMNQLYELMGSVDQSGCQVSVTVNTDQQQFVSADGNCDPRAGIESNTNEE